MDNFAHRLQPKKNNEQEKKVNSTPKQKIQKYKITLGEKLLLVACGILVTVMAVAIISKTAMIYSENREIQTLQNEIDNQTKLNKDYQLQVTELSSPERIRKIAEEQLGMKLDSKKVKFVGQ